MTRLICRTGDRTNGGIVGVTNEASFGKGVQTVKTSTAAVTTQPGSRLAQVLIGAGGGGSGGRGSFLTFLFAAILEAMIFCVLVSASKSTIRRCMSITM